MNIPLVDLGIQYLSIKEEVDDCIREVIEGSAFIKGKYVEKFESEFAELHKCKSCIGVANGTDAIFIALKALGIGSGDEVITTAHSWISTSETISLTGAKPIFVDTEESFYTIDTSKIEKSINSKTKAIIPVHIYGHPANMNEIKNLCEKYSLYLIEDCAQAHLAEYNENKVGTIGDVGTFSFFPGKNLGAYGDAGAVITNNENLSTKMRMFANHGSLVKHEHQIEGINSRLDGIQAAILSVKLKHLEKWTELRIGNSLIYKDMLSEINNLFLPLTRKDSKHVFHIFSIRTKNRDNLKNYLYENGISTGIHYPSALPNLPAYEYLNHSPEDFPIATRNQYTQLSLPMYPELTIEQIEYICTKIKVFFEN